MAIPKEYYTEGVPELCHAAKDGNTAAIKKMAEEMAAIVPRNGILIPAPQHQGFAVYTLAICREIAAHTGATVCDVLRCTPHESLYTARKKGQDLSLQFYLTDCIPEGTLFFVDNVISTGKTLEAARKVIGKQIIPLVYAVDSTRYKSHDHLGGILMETQRRTQEKDEMKMQYDVWETYPGYEDNIIFEGMSLKEAEEAVHDLRGRFGQGEVNYIIKPTLKQNYHAQEKDELYASPEADRISSIIASSMAKERESESYIKAYEDHLNESISLELSGTFKGDGPYYINVINLQMRDGSSVTIDREGTDGDSYEDGTFSMKWRGTYLWDGEHEVPLTKGMDVTKKILKDAVSYTVDFDDDAPEGVRIDIQKLIIDNRTIPPAEKENENRMSRTSKMWQLRKSHKDMELLLGFCSDEEKVHLIDHTKYLRCPWNDDVIPKITDSALADVIVHNLVAAELQDETLRLMEKHAEDIDAYRLTQLLEAYDGNTTDFKSSFSDRNTFLLQKKSYIRDSSAYAGKDFDGYFEHIAETVAEMCNIKIIQQCSSDIANLVKQGESFEHAFKKYQKSCCNRLDADHWHKAKTVARKKASKYASRI